jgi:hypothetical protein
MTLNTKGWKRAGKGYGIRPPSNDYKKQRTWSMLELVGMLVILVLVSLHLIGLWSY